MAGAHRRAPAHGARNAPPVSGPRVEGMVGRSRRCRRQARDGVVYGAGVGYDFPAGGVVVGVEAEAADVDRNGAARFRAGDVLPRAPSRDLYAGARVGARRRPGNTLLYAKAGYTNAAASMVIAAPARLRQRDNLEGVRVGAGVESGLGDARAT